MLAFLACFFLSLYRRATIRLQNDHVINLVALRAWHACGLHAVDRVDCQHTSSFVQLYSAESRTGGVDGGDRIYAQTAGLSTPNPVTHE